MSERIKAIALLSGLDSILAVKLVQEQEIEVIGVSFTTPFFGSDDVYRIAEQLGIPLHVVDITADYIPMLLHPRYGYGKNMNPCIDCHILMVKKALELLEPLGASFIITGEVLGERPMSQNQGALRIVERDSGAEGLLLRPLSAKLLPPTIPEQKGWVDRERLLDIRGRSRKPQMALAEKFGITEYPTPGGGCLLTDPGYAQRLKRYLAFNPTPEKKELELLKYGRHFHVANTNHAWIVVSRKKEENELVIANMHPGDYLLHLRDLPGPRTIIKGKNIGNEVLRQAAALTARYSRKAREREIVTIVAKKPADKQAQEIVVSQAEIQDLVAKLKPL